MSELHVLRVFLGPGDAGGNPLGVFLDGGGLAATERQRIAADLGFSETVFVEDSAAGRIRIYTPTGELPFAGHPTVGTAWLLGEVGAAPAMLRVPAGEVPTWREGDVTWVRARAAWVRDIAVEQLPSPSDVEALDGPPGSVRLAADGDACYAWAWIDEGRGRVRSRFFVERRGVREDEATGAAAIVLAARLGRALEIDQGLGSRISTRIGDGGTTELGGRCALVERRDYPSVTPSGPRG